MQEHIMSGRSDICDSYEMPFLFPTLQHFNSASVSTGLSPCIEQCTDPAMVESRQGLHFSDRRRIQTKNISKFEGSTPEPESTLALNEPSGQDWTRRMQMVLESANTIFTDHGTTKSAYIQTQQVELDVFASMNAPI